MRWAVIKEKEGKLKRSRIGRVKSWRKAVGWGGEMKE